MPTTDDSKAATPVLASCRVARFPTPPVGTPLLALSDNERASLGLPTLDDADSDAVLAFRVAFLRAPHGRPLQFISLPTSSVVGPTSRITPLSAPSGAWPVQKSLNWSGGYVLPRNGQSFVSVMGRWRVPTVSAPGGPTAPTFHSSTWIGLDGQRFYHNSSLPQIGTSQVWTPGQRPQEGIYKTWYQWWARHETNSFQILPLDVEPNDEISAILTVLNPPKTVRFNLKNETQGKMLQAFLVAGPETYRVSGATAEWVMERPSDPPKDAWHAFPLPSYTSFAFTHCLAQASTPGSSTLQTYDLQTAQLIRMYEISQNPTSVRTISSARRVLQPAERLELTYTGP